MNEELLGDLQATLTEKTGRRWEVTAHLDKVEVEMYVTVDGRLARVSYPVHISVLKNAYGLAVEKILEGCALEIGRLIVGLTGQDD